MCRSCNAIPQHEPAGDREPKLRYWRHVSKWAQHLPEYERAEGMIAGLLAGRVPVDVKAAEPSSLKEIQAAADAEFAARLVMPMPFAAPVPTEVLMRDPRSGLTAWVPGPPLTRADAIAIAERKTHQHVLHDPAAPGIEPIPPPTRTVRIKKIIKLDAQENIQEIIEYDVQMPVGEHGAPVIEPPLTDPERLGGAPRTPPAP